MRNGVDRRRDALHVEQLDRHAVVLEVRRDLLDPGAESKLHAAFLESRIGHFERMVTRGTVKLEDFRIIFKSPIFPTSSFAYAYDLKPDLARKITDCFFAFRFPDSMQKEFNGDDRFVPITYKETWKVVREIAEGSGEWDILFRKYYSEELRKLGVAT